MTRFTTNVAHYDCWTRVAPYEKLKFKVLLYLILSCARIILKVSIPITSYVSQSKLKLSFQAHARMFEKLEKLGKTVFPRANEVALSVQVNSSTD